MPERLMKVSIRQNTSISVCQQKIILITHLMAISHYKRSPEGGEKSHLADDTDKVYEELMEL